MLCARCGEQIVQPRSGPVMWASGNGADSCATGGLHEPDDGNNNE